MGDIVYAGFLGLVVDCEATKPFDDVVARGLAGVRHLIDAGLPVLRVAVALFFFGLIFCAADEHLLTTDFYGGGAGFDPHVFSVFCRLLVRGSSHHRLVVGAEILIWFEPSTHQRVLNNELQLLCLVLGPPKG